MNKDIGIVAIGRNEGEKLKRCLHSALSQTNKIVYVDSGSSDESVAYAESTGVEVFKLDMSIPFSAGRARNEGFLYIIRKYPQLQFIQFIDGDCELYKGWLASASEYLENQPSCAIVAGRLKERFPEKSIYNLICDLEWNTHFGDVKSCGGIFMVREKTFKDIGGFNIEVVAGEEPELCYRLRKTGWNIYKLDQLMALHDAAMTKFSQWWKRAIRSGYAYAHGYELHGSEREKYCLRDSLRIWFWSLIVPGLIFFLALVLSPWWLLLFALYMAQGIKIAININKHLIVWRHSFYYATFNIIGKWPQLIGQILFMKRKISGQKYKIIEYS